MNDLTIHMELERKARENFTDTNKKWREGTAKTSFTYLLLDPRMTDNLPVKAGKQNKHLSWVTFVNSIFYVGKGKTYSTICILNIYLSFVDSNDRNIF